MLLAVAPAGTRSAGGSAQQLSAGGLSARRRGTRSARAAQRRGLSAGLRPRRLSATAQRRGPQRKAAQHTVSAGGSAQGSAQGGSAHGQRRRLSTRSAGMLLP